ncbi:MAG: bifunctional diaminohydroxyphosphoribosylaminopyrimidine deaminase/5-amino-6-(5-phosphoribosylamino)uracil reductase RibD [Desulfuromonadales bacterium]|nr:bifunctional diaminohydroxyphosphoribosylaminopyrimidine deaminase/5-amino-6-(5-phosphoribosylamino)uracil reductase RibD [Desulfuromonadales bacterium]
MKGITVADAAVVALQSEDERYMRRALELARRAEGRTAPNPAVGAVVVRDNVIVGEGFHPAAGEPHAEIFALRQAGNTAQGATLYVTLEPCCHCGRTGPCATAVIAAGIVRVVAGCRDPNPRVAGGGFAQLQGAGIEVVSGILEGECRRLIAPFAKHVRTGLPYVTLKAGMTIDGAVATACGESQWITGAESRAAVHHLRDIHDAIMVGIGTVLADNPRLTTRLAQGAGKNPLRIIVDSTLRTPSSAALLAEAGNTLILTSAAASAADVERLRSEQVEILRVAGHPGAIDLVDAMRQLGARGIQSILLEGGGRLHHSALHAGIVDRLCIFVAPLLLGGNGLPVFSGPGVSDLKDAFRLRQLQVECYGDDLLLHGELESSCLPD